MQQVSQLRPQGGRLGAQVARLLHSHRAAWWFRLLARTGVAHVVGYFAVGIFIIAFRIIRVIPNYDRNASYFSEKDGIPACQRPS